MNQYNPEEVLIKKMSRFVLLKNQDYVKQIEKNLFVFIYNTIKLLYFLNT